jgi:hypothetical protein
MSDILTDAAFSNLEVTENLFFRNRNFIDQDMNVHANTIHCDFIRCRNIHIEDAVVNDPSNFLNRSRDIQQQRVVSDVSETSRNDASGEHAACLGGTFNEALGDRSVTVAGQENMATGSDAIAMGVAAFAKHDQTLVWNTNPEQPLETTRDKQCMLASDGGMFFKLPLSTDVQTHMMPEGFACWCWDAEKRTVALKTKQQNVLYKTHLDTLEHELRVSLLDPDDANGVRLVLHNPDDS